MKNRDVIEELYYSYLKQKKEASDAIKRNDDKIREIDLFLQSIVNEDNDRKFFSPIKTDSLYEGRIELERSERDSLISENARNTSLIEDLDVKILKFKEILDDDSSASSENNISEGSSFNDINASVLSIQEEERQRISAELHDNTVQNLVHIGHSLELTSLFIDQDPVRAKLELETIRKSLKDTVDEIRDIIFDLRPMSLDDLDFNKALEDFVDNLKFQNPDIKFEIETDSFEADSSVKILLYRIISEAMINAVKHAQASYIYLGVKVTDNECVVKIKDTGVGFNPDEVVNKHFGISIMKERVKMLQGTFSLNSVSGAGTQIEIRFPIR